MSRAGDAGPQSSSVDGDGLPFPDDAKLAQLQAEGLSNPPRPEDWAGLTAMLRHAAEIGRSGKSNPDLPPGMTEIQMSLRAVVEFLQRKPILMDEDAVGPLLRLEIAIVDGSCRVAGW